MDLGITDRVAIVTGASSGIGYAIAKELISNNTKVLIAARGEDHLQAAEQTLGQLPGARVASIAVDVTNKDAAQRILDKTMDSFGAPDILVNNAGRAHAGGLLTSSEDDWEEMTAVKLTSMRRMCKAAVPFMQEKGWGRIVNMSSIGGIYPNPKLFISHVLSAAINNLTKSLALEVAADNILVNAIGVGAVKTDNWARNMIPFVRKNNPDLADLSDDDLIARISEKCTPVRRPGAPEDIATLAAYLCSARNNFVTGDTIEASGGADRFM
ncbi:SDR family NAD(P)-dependent oxidoreductase [Roseibium sp. RKSG952]|uniref:SDR family NAD(P)-dependent oxidoreductase n=1 Tax=Roseibium sp. RKSG952 TaxID=2529384 RepID=UPI0012BB83B1|nr:SDR family oxidoreductase [Roseibium sp. RKSG952]MTH95949.1 SDR family oxidoreductase [Roseibium sp. RKSG952]